MHHPVIISFDVKDVVPQQEKGKRTRHRQQFEHIKNKRDTIAQPREPQGIHTNHAFDNIHHTPSLKQTLRPSSANNVIPKKTSPPVKPVYNDAPWVVITAAPNRDLLIIQQDKDISQYKMRHPNPFNDRCPPAPTLVTDQQATEKKRKSVINRQRILPNTSGAVLNASLPSHPRHRANTSSIHNNRWSCTTVLAEEPRRSRPSTAGNSKSREHFQREFHTDPTKAHLTNGEIDVLRSLSIVG